MEVSSPDPSVHMLIRSELRYHPDGYQHQYKFKYGTWDGYDYLYDLSDARFRVGLWPRVKSLLEYKGLQFSLEETPHPEEQLINVNMRPSKMTPFDYQYEAAQATMNHERGLIVSPTGSGKTYIISLALSILKCKAMVIVTDIVLLDQMQDALSRFLDVEIGMIGDGEFNIQDITVTTIQSLVSILKAKSIKGADKRILLVKAMKEIGVVVSDEAHLADSDSFDIVMPQFPNTRRFYGLSATPYGWADKAEKKSNIVLEQHFGETIYDSRKLNFVKIGIKVPLLIESVHLDYVNEIYETHYKRGPGGKKSLDHGKNYRECLETELLNNHEYQAKVAELAWQEMANGRSVFIHAGHSLEFGEAVNALIRKSVV